MNRKYNSALFTLALLMFCAVFTAATAPSLFAQKTDSPKSEESTKQCSGEKFVMPPSIAVGGEAFTTFIKVMSLPSGARQKAFSDLPNEGKANVFKVQLALNFITRPNLTKEQKDLILETISMTSADTYDKANSENAAKANKQAQELEIKALGIFPPNDAYQIFADMNGDKKADVALLQKYEELLMLPTLGQRKKFFREVSPLNRMTLWKAQMIYYLATSKLNRNQQDFILEVISLSTLKAFEFPTVEGEVKNHETKALDALEEKAFKLFSKEEVGAFFMSLGVHKIPKLNQNVESQSMEETCDCNYTCFSPCTYCYTGTGCKKSETGCGWTLGSPCSNRCRIDVGCPY
jgi:hypothetical protein